MESKNCEYNDMREARGAALFATGHVCVTEDCFYVQSNTDAGVVYKVQDNECECPDFQKRGKPCKHIFAVEYYFLCNGVNC